MRIQFWPKVCPKNGKTKVEQAYFCAGDQNKYHVMMEELELTSLLWEFEKIARAQIYEAMNVVSVYTDPAQTAGYMWRGQHVDRFSPDTPEVILCKYPRHFNGELLDGTAFSLLLVLLLLLLGCCKLLFETR